MEIDKNEIERVLNLLKSKIDNNVLDSLLKIMAEFYITLSNIQRDLSNSLFKINIQNAMLPLIAQRYKGLTNIEITPETPLSKEQGFYDLEYDNEGNIYRWTGPEKRFYFDLHLDRSIPLQFRLNVLIKNEKQRQIRAFSDEIEIPLTIMDNKGLIEYSGILLPRQVIGLTRIYFLIPELIKPEEPDKRLLGVIFKGFKIFPYSGEELENHINIIGDKKIAKNYKRLVKEKERGNLP